MASTGFTREDYEPEPVDVWPENWPSWCLFSEMSGQWRTAGMNGQNVALDYTALFLRMQRMTTLTDAEWVDLYADVRVIEHAALKQMNKAA